MQNCAFNALEIAESILAEGDMRSTINLIREALKCSRSFRVVRSAGRLILLDGTVWLWQRVQTALESQRSKSRETTGALTNSHCSKE
jgi:hypothetical protein